MIHQYVVLESGAGPFGSSVASELANVLLNCRIESSLQLGSISKHEQNFKPDEERCQEESLDQVVQQRRSTAFEDTMADELRYPGDNVNTNGDVVGRHAIVRGQVICICCATDQDRSKKTSRDRFHQHIQRTVDYGNCSAEVEREMWNAERFRNWNSWCIRALQWKVRTMICNISSNERLTNRIAVRRIAGTHVMWIAILTCTTYEYEG